MRWLLLTLMLPIPPSTAATVPARQTAPAEPARCAGLHATYEKVLKQLAQSVAEGATGSPKSYRLRQVEYRNALALAEMSVESLRSGGCIEPSDPPSGETYLLAAIRCEKERIAAQKARPPGGTPASCDKAKWRPFAD